MPLHITAHGNRWASLGQKIVLTVDDTSLTLRAPFYRRTLPLTEIKSATAALDDGMNRGVRNWFVTGRANSLDGVRLNNGGKARIDILTRSGARYAVVVDALGQAQQIVEAIESGSPSTSQNDATQATPRSQ